MLDQNQTTAEKLENRKLIIYQLFVRYFGNKISATTSYGTIKENGVGKFNDITTKALNGIKELGTTHIWYTGVIEHATMTDYTAFDIQVDDPDVVKGIAGSPYAIKDYYDVDPDLAMEVPKRIEEFEELIRRTHLQDLKVIIDFVPNHVARTYKSDRLPNGVEDLGAKDNVDLAFDVNNDFYYIPGHKFTGPYNYQAGGKTFHHQLKDGKFQEFPAKATGNNVFNPNPTVDDWFETIKLNYGLDFSNHSKHFIPRPPVWEKMRDILLFWASKGVDGFRCDMVEHVPIEFWNWVIGDLKTKFHALIFIGEAYDRDQYSNFIEIGKFDYLYDKVGLYDGLKKLIMDDYQANVADISDVWKEECKRFSQHMLRFLENHDETRIASTAFAGNVWHAVPAMIVTATLSTGPVMIYNGQEVGEPANDAQGFSGNDGRSTIFDYWNLPSHQRWMNEGEFDGGGLNDNEKLLREFYVKILNICKANIALAEGDFYELLVANQHSKGFNQKVYAYLRFKNETKVLILVNFNRASADLTVKFPPDVIEKFGLANKVVTFIDLLSDISLKTNSVNSGLDIILPPTSGVVLQF